MNTRLISKDGQSYLECLADGGIMTSEADALDLVAACGENGTDRLLLHASNLNEDFYNLKTGLAGAALLKFSNYYIKVAAVIPAEIANRGRFGEMVLETNHGNAFRVYQDEDKAVQWLIK
jgi:PadR family transcriptional regulator AphA